MSPHSACASTAKRRPRASLAPALLVLLIGLTVAAAPADESGVTASMLAVDTARSRAEFTISHFMVLRVHGTMPVRSAAIGVSPTDGALQSVEVVVDPAGVDTGSGARDRDLRSPHFFEVARYPTILFHSSHIETKPSGDFTIDGQVTVHGVERPITVQGHVDGRPTLGQTVVYRATARLRRSDFGMTYGGPVVGNDVAVDIAIEARLNEASSPPAGHEAL